MSSCVSLVVISNPTRCGTTRPDPTRREAARRDPTRRGATQTRTHTNTHTHTKTLARARTNTRRNVYFMMTSGTAAACRARASACVVACAVAHDLTACATLCLSVCLSPLSFLSLSLYQPASCPARSRQRRRHVRHRRVRRQRAAAACCEARRAVAAHGGCPVASSTPQAMTPQPLVTDLSSTLNSQAEPANLSFCYPTKKRRQVAHHPPTPAPLL